MADDYQKDEIGTVYIKNAAGTYEVWFENFCIIGLGATRTEALEDAETFVTGLSELVKTALAGEPVQAASGGR